MFKSGVSGSMDIPNLHPVLLSCSGTHHHRDRLTYNRDDLDSE